MGVFDGRRNRKKKTYRANVERRKNLVSRFLQPTVSAPNFFGPQQLEKTGIIEARRIFLFTLSKKQKITKNLHDVYVRFNTQLHFLWYFIEKDKK